MEENKFKLPIQGCIEYCRSNDSDRASKLGVGT